MTKKEVAEKLLRVLLKTNYLPQKLDVHGKPLPVKATDKYFEANQSTGKLVLHYQRRTYDLAEMIVSIEVVQHLCKELFPETANKLLYHSPENDGAVGPDWFPWQFHLARIAVSEDRWTKFSNIFLETDAYNKVVEGFGDNGA